MAIRNDILSSILPCIVCFRVTHLSPRISTSPDTIYLHAHLEYAGNVPLGIPPFSREARLEIDVLFSYRGHYESYVPRSSISVEQFHAYGLRKHHRQASLQSLASSFISVHTTNSTLLSRSLNFIVWSCTLILSRTLSSSWNKSIQDSRFRFKHSHHEDVESKWHHLKDSQPS